VIIKFEGKNEHKTQIDSPVKEVNILFRTKDNSVRIFHPKEALAVIRLKELKEWKSTFEVSLITGFYTNTKIKAHIQVPLAWEKNCTVLYRILWLCRYMFHRTHKDLYQQKEGED
jgi:hypothetical protein